MHPTFLHRQSGNGKVSRLRRMAIFIRDSFRCQHCNKDLSRKNAYGLCLMKFDPAGKEEPQNLITACLICSREFRKYRPEQLFKPKSKYIEMRKHLDSILDISLARDVLLGENIDYPNPWQGL